MKKEMEYVESNNKFRLIRTELLLAPLLVIAPFLLGFHLINDWYLRDMTLNQLELEIELVIGVIIIVANIIFDIPFLRSLKHNWKNKK